MTAKERHDQAWKLVHGPRASEAVQIYEELVVESASRPLYWWALGIACRNTGNFDRSVEAHQTATELDPKWEPAWSYLSRALLAAGRLDEAEEAAYDGITNCEEDTDCWRALAEVAGKKEDWSGQLEKLDIIVERGEATARDFNSIGAAHLKLKNFRQAADWFSRAAAKKPSAYYFCNAAMAFRNREVSQDLDAADAYCRALELEPENEVASIIFPKLKTKLENLFVQVYGFGETLLSSDEWFQQYINPFELLNADPTDSLESLEDRDIQRLRKILFHEIAVEDGRVEWMDNVVVDLSRARQVCDEIADERLKRFHWEVFTNERLNQFLTRGNIKHFLFDPDYYPSETLDLLDDADLDFRAWLSTPFAKQYNRVLGRALESRNRSLAPVEALLDGRRWVKPSDDDLCFERAIHIVREMIEPLKVFAATVEHRKPTLQEIQTVLTTNRLAETLNLLPIHFRQLQSEAVGYVRSISIDLHNHHEDTDMAKAVLELSKKFSFKSAELTDQLKEDFDKLEALIREQRKHEGKLTSGKMPWEVTKEGIRQGQQFLAVVNISSIRWGIVVKGTQYAPVYDFLIAFRDDGGREVVFTWQSSHDQKVKSTEHFQNLVRAALAYVMPTIIAKTQARLESGENIRIGSCVVSKGGVTFESQGWFFSKTNVVPWHTIGSEIENGKLIVFDQANPKAKTAMSLMHTENAMVLKFMSDAAR